MLLFTMKVLESRRNNYFEPVLEEHKRECTKRVSWGIPNPLFPFLSQYRYNLPGVIYEVILLDFSEYEAARYEDEPNEGKCLLSPHLTLPTFPLVFSLTYATEQKRRLCNSMQLDDPQPTTLSEMRDETILLLEVYIHFFFHFFI